MTKPTTLHDRCCSCDGARLYHRVGDRYRLVAYPRHERTAYRRAALRLTDVTGVIPMYIGGYTYVYPPATSADSGLSYRGYTYVYPPQRDADSRPERIGRYTRHITCDAAFLWLNERWLFLDVL